MTRKMRRQHWVDARVQGTLIRRIVIHWCTFFVVTLLCVSLMQLLLGDPNKTITERMSSPEQNLLLLGMIMLSLLPIFVLDTIRFSNRFVGPIARLRRSMRELVAGEKVPTLAFRDNDFWTEVADEFNSISQMVQDQEAEIKKLKEQVAESPESVNV